MNQPGVGRVHGNTVDVVNHGPGKSDWKQDAVKVHITAVFSVILSFQYNYLIHFMAMYKVCMM